MLSFMALTSCSLVSSRPFTNLNSHTFPSVVFVVDAKRVARKREKTVSFNLFEARNSGVLLGIRRLKRRSFCGKRDWEGEGDLVLEAEILEFMRNSENPELFPSKKQLLDAGRMDLAEAILKKGGWLSLGWDLNDGKEVEDGFAVNDDKFWNLTTEDEYENGAVDERALESSEGKSSTASSSGRSLGEAENDSGIEGILGRLEKERNMSFGFPSIEKENSAHPHFNDVKDDWLPKTSIETTVAGLKRTSKPASLSSNKEIISDSGAILGQNRSFSNTDGFRNSLKPETWRAWSSQRAGCSDQEFEADEIASDRTRLEGRMDVPKYEILEIREGASETLNRRKNNSTHEESNHKEIRDRLQHLQSELASVLVSLRSNTTESVAQKGHEDSSNILWNLSDAWEFQENEIMNAQNRIRSTRAKLAVIEGKMALAMIDAQKMVEERQKRIDDAHRALCLLHTACIVWPNSASEVLLAGSFDGWATQRRMEKSKTGIFSLYLKLYPGRYEIKFIVDGEWKVDPLRPIVHNSGFENNLLIIT